MKKACVATYCEWNSYGSVMQSLGLKQTLLQLGVQSYIVKAAPAPVSTKAFPLQFHPHPKQLILDMVKNLRRGQLRTNYENSVKFINEHLDILYYNDYATVCQTPPQADYYIAGSDQVWHPHNCNPLFFLDFLEDNTKKLSYAASMGITAIPSEKESLFHDLIRDFQSVSVREDDMMSILQKHTDRPVSVNIDPTFLQAPDMWRSYSRPYPVKKPYILVYAIYWDKQINKTLQKLHRETGYDIIALGNGFPAVWSTRWVSDADPAQFLWLIEHAEAVVSSSFHGVAFSLIFNKKLAAVINPKAPSRIQSLFDRLQYQNVPVSEVLTADISKYKAVNAKIEEEKQKSFQYLKEILQIHE